MTTVTPAMRTLPPRRLNLAEHERLYGTVTFHEQVIELIAEAGILGRGGAGFPAARKLAAIRGRRPIVVANGCESDPLSMKDRALLANAPHLVLDGIQVAAHAVHATEAVLCTHRPIDSIAAALAERTDRVPTRIVEIPQHYVASEESALVHYLTDGDARPLGKYPRPTEHGVDGRPTLVQNVDTLAQFALAVRVGAEAYRRTRTELVTIGGAVTRSGVVEVPAGTTIGDLLTSVTTPVQAVLTGGYGGTWLPWPDAAAMRPTGVSSVYALPETSCGIAFTAHVLQTLAAESARQCGPCMFGLPAIASDFAELLRGNPAALPRVSHRLPVIPGRGACAHPDGAVRLAASALQVFHYDLMAHLRTRSCAAT